MGAALFPGIRTAAAHCALADAMLLVRLYPVRGRPESGLMLARLLPGGVFELLSHAAWGRALGYPPEELNGKWLHELLPLGEPAAGTVVSTLLDTSDSQPLNVTLLCKDERRKCFRFHRRYDAYEQSVFVLADELS